MDRPRISCNSSGAGNPFIFVIRGQGQYVRSMSRSFSAKTCETIITIIYPHDRFNQISFDRILRPTNILHVITLKVLYSPVATKTNEQDSTDKKADVMRAQVSMGASRPDVTLTFLVLLASFASLF